MLNWVHGVLGLLITAVSIVAWREFSARRFCSALLSLDGALGDERNPGELGRQLLAAICGVVHSPAGLLYEEEQGVTGLRLKASFGLDRSRLGEAAGDPGIRARLLKQAASPGATVSQTELQESGGFLADYVSALTVPMFSGTRLIGVVLVFRTHGRFSPRDQRILSRFVSRAATSLDNARFNLQNKNAAEENARLYVNLSRLYRQATVDSLTGLHNRGYMQQRLREEIKKAWRFKQPLALVLMGLDKFGRVNEFHGQKTGDEILREMARIVRAVARDYDISCRYGGDEILLALPQTDIEGAVAFAERLKQQVAKQELTAGVRLTCSLGAASLEVGGTPAGSARQRTEASDATVHGLLRSVEEAMQRAKQFGGDRVVTGKDLDSGVPADGAL